MKNYKIDGFGNLEILRFVVDCYKIFNEKNEVLIGWCIGIWMIVIGMLSLRDIIFLIIFLCLK